VVVLLFSFIFLECTLVACFMIDVLFVMPDLRFLRFWLIVLFIIVIFLIFYGVLFMWVYVLDYVVWY
ncbi:hypothetical protein, partial [Klebsiella pneumoniae]|uniref:hypothetical protein n=1 Tax=Klebsiella pneumoniae TaxID=573 RepID=UPI002730A562